MKKFIEKISIIFVVFGIETVFAQDDYLLVLDGYGVFFDEGPIDQYIDPDDSTSGLRTVTDPFYLCQTEIIPMKPGISFGIYYRINGTYDQDFQGEVNIETHRPIITDAMDNPTTVNYWQSEVSHYDHDLDGYVGGALFYFENKNELVPGEWRIVVKFRNQSIEKYFEVTSDSNVVLSDCKIL